MPTYYNRTGKHQQEYEELVRKLIPVTGKASTLLGESLRCIGNLAYEFYNNGGCNARDCEPPGEDTPLTEDYTEQLDFLYDEAKLPCHLWTGIRLWLQTDGQGGRYNGHRALDISSDHEDEFDQAINHILETIPLRVVVEGGKEGE